MDTDKYVDRSLKIVNLWDFNSYNSLMCNIVFDSYKNNTDH